MAGSEAGTDSPWRWQEGPVDQHQTHLQIRYVPNLKDPEAAYLVALVSSPNDHRFTVEFVPQNVPATLNSGAILDEVKRELNFYLIEKDEADPWKYARYHCTTASNLYSQVQGALAIR